MEDGSNKLHPRYSFAKETAGAAALFAGGVARIAFTDMSQICRATRTLVLQGDGASAAHGTNSRWI